MVIAVLIFIYSVVRWSIKYFTQDKGIRWIISVAVMLIATCLIYIYAATIYNLRKSEWENKKFSRELWRDDKEIRFTIAKDLIETGVLINKDTFQLKALLGEADVKNALKHWVYQMGSSGWGLGWALHSLQVKVVDGRVSQVDWNRIID